MEFLKSGLDSFRELIRDKSSDSESEVAKIRCLLVGSTKSQKSAVSALEKSTLEIRPQTDITAATERTVFFDCVLLMIDGRDQKATDLVYEVSQKVLTPPFHASRLAVTIAPGREADTRKILLLLHKRFPKLSYYIEYGDGRAAINALTALTKKV